MSVVSLELPDDVAERLEQGGRDLARRALEALALEAYRAGEITAAQVQQMLGLASRWETEAFLKDRQAYLRYSEADLEADLQALHRVAQP
jgi:predicted HTH domain antitoxin